MITEQNSPEEIKNKSQRGFVLDSLLQGFLILLPLTIILILLSIIFNFIFGIVAPLSAILEPGSEDPHWLINVLSLGILCVFIFIIGLLVRNRVGKVYFKIFEKKYLAKLPLYNLIHQTVYQFVGLKKLPFSEVVLIDPFRSGTMMTGFVTDQIGEHLYTVFVPTAPNPTNGNIYHVPKELITFLKATTQDAMRTVMGMGTGTADMLSGMQLTDILTDGSVKEIQKNKFIDDTLNPLESIS
ncbi:putative membrane protein [Algoriphagus ratkowskyi]|uniref:DUF502 domain-containing protein n=1 Tax=Algoriphagus ratkowskyi TaxID=57028 RepID=A0A2W7SS49_9BACT|nr:DUF502 domain-containing protein [Algoriphagus ratkowskyi]PZX53462.1 putative membrane protein [Algoriphagus ratkowskyi]TXD76501.1 DUF502 domain-containing protein [Algoriphagus ratkowskyi]